MTYRIVHLGDLHLQATHPRNADRLAALDQALASAQDGGPVALWVWPGDLFHARSTVQDRNDLAARLVPMADVAEVVIVPGNHDAPGDLDVFGKLKARHRIHVVNQPGVVYVLLQPQCDRAGVFCLPYPSKAGLVSAGVAHESLHLAASQALDVLFMEAAAQLGRLQAAGLITLMAGHATIGGAVTSTGQPQIGTELEISQAHLDRLGPVPKLLNHIHKHQNLGNGAGYAGSLCRLSWGEVEPKGYQVIEFEEVET